MGASTINPTDANKLVNSGIATTAPADVTSAWKNAMIKKMLGIPLQTPEEKAAQQFNTFKAKQDYKRSQPTQRLLSQNQLSLQAVDNVVPVLDDLQGMARRGEIPGQFLDKYLMPDAQAAYLSKIGTAKDTLIKGLGLNPTDSIVTLMNEIAGMQPREDSAAYIKKLDQLKIELKRRRQGYADASTNPYPAAKDSKVEGIDPLGWR